MVQNIEELLFFNDYWRDMEGISMSRPVYKDLWLLMIMVLIAMLVPFTGTANAACTYAISYNNTSTVPVVTAGTTTPFQELDLVVTLDNLSAENLAGNEFTLRLPSSPSGYGMTVGNISTDTGTNGTPVVLSANGALESVNAWVYTENAGYGSGTFNWYRIVVTSVTNSNNSSSDTTFLVPIYALSVPVSANGNIYLTAASPNGSLFAPGSVVIATAEGSLGGGGGGGGGVMPSYDTSYVPLVTAGSVNTPATGMKNLELLITLNNASAADINGSTVVLNLPSSSAGYGMKLGTTITGSGVFYNANIPSSVLSPGIQSSTDPGGGYVSYTVYMNNVTNLDINTNVASSSLIIPITELYVPSGVIGDITLTAVPPNGSLFPSGNTLVACVAVPTVTLEAESVPVVHTGAAQQIGTIDITENMAAALEDSGGAALKLILPDGFTWSGTPTLAQMWGAWNNNPGWQLNPNVDGGQELDITGGSPVSAGYYASSTAVFAKLTGCVNIDQAVAKQGLVAVTVDGTSNYTPSDFTVANFSGQSTFSGGSGTSNDPYQIVSAVDLNNIRYVSGSVYFKLMNDIDLSQSVYKSTNQISVGVGGYVYGWEPIPFEGYFDGGGHTISGLYIDNESGLYGT
jgi:hypothetical protein